RIVGIPGDSVRIVSGEVYVNGKKLDEPYVLDAYRDHDSMETEIVPPGDYFVLGDHRNSSSDSRTWGFVARKEIYGKAVLVYWPLTKIGRVH
ncbi:MAG TPA: signal peptidase I, partial [Bryobacteraceae bacterium]|nr:signal peptidase I [Bryobacteraceae bacterium]